MSNDDAAALKDQLLARLRTVRDPASGRDALSAGLIEEIEIDGDRVLVKVGLAGAPMPVQVQVRAGVAEAIGQIEGIKKVLVEMVAPAPPAGAPPAPSSPPAPSADAPRRLPMAMAPGGGAAGRGPAAGQGQGHGHGQGIAGRQTLPGVRHIVAVASGKGGVGKSTVCVNLALALRHLGARVGLLDADIYGPSIPLMMDVNRRPQAAPDGRIVPLTSYGIKLMSLGFLLDEATPVIWRGPMVQGVIRQFLLEVDWGTLDYLMIDLPPGTGDAQLSLVQAVSLSGAVIVTTPSDLALIDAAKGLNMFRTVEVPVLGVVENMSYFVCPHCTERSDIFSAGGGKQVAAKLDAPFLGEIPLESAIRKGGDEGKPVVAAAPDSVHARPFLDLARAVRDRLEGTGEGREEKREADKKSFFGSLFSRT